MRHTITRLGRPFRVTAAVVAVALVGVALAACSKSSNSSGSAESQTLTIATGAGLGFVLGGKTAEIYDFVDRRVRSRIVMRVSPMDALAADLESVRRALSTSGWTNHSEQPSRRLFVFSGAEWAQILGMGVLLLVAAVVAA